MTLEHDRPLISALSLELTILPCAMWPVSSREVTIASAALTVTKLQSKDNANLENVPTSSGCMVLLVDNSFFFFFF